MVPDRWIARCKGASFCNAKCVRALVVECNHWAGEEPYNKERAEQIRKAVENARCDRLASEEQVLEFKYKGHKKVLDAIAKAKVLNM